MNERLIIKAKKGDQEAFCRLMDAHTQSMYKVAWSYLSNNEDVADAIQETILACFEKLPTLRQNRYFKTWLLRILINKCSDILRKNSRVTYMEKPPERSICEEDYNSLEWDQLLGQLDEKYRVILLLYYLEGFNTREIAELLELKESTVKSRLQRGRQKISGEFLYKVKEAKL